MKDNIQEVVSVIAGETSLKLITITGNVIEMREDSTYDTARLIKDITPQLTGGNVVSVNLSDYLAVVKALSEPEYENQGIKITHMVDGQEVQGIFYPQKVSVQVQTSPDEEPVTIPEVENLEKHINRAAQENSPAVRNFLKRLAPVVRDRRHSAEDLMKFIKKCEMPLTHDGKIIGYKRVKQGANDDFVDCHSGKITQRIGSRVFMDIDGVDPDRNRACSHGLHVANLGYLNSFHGSHILIVLVDPKDFIAVPMDGGGTKCRVCSYDIIGIITGSAHKVVASSQVPEDATFSSLVKDAIEGRYIRPDEVVKVGKQVVLERRPITEDELVDALSGTIEQAVEGIQTRADSLEKDAVQKRESTKEALSEARGTVSKKWLKGPEGLLGAFKDLMEEVKSKAQIARDHGTSTRTLQRWQEKYDFKGYVADQKASAETPAETKETPSTPVKKPAKVSGKTLGLKEQVQSLYSEWDHSGKQEDFDALLAFKKKRKKGWQAIGLNAVQEKKVLKHLKKTGA